MGVFHVRKFYNNCLFFDRYRNISISVCSIVLIVLFIFFILFSVFYEFNFSTSYSGIVVKEDRYYVNMFISDNGIWQLQKNVLVVDGQVVDYSIKKSSDEYVPTDNGLVRSVLLDLDLDDSKKIVNNVVKLNFLEKTTIFNKIKEMFK